MSINKNIILLLLILCSCTYINLNKISFAKCNNNLILLRNDELTIDEAKDILLKYNNKINYIYQGSSDEFKFLKSKNLKGYVFLPNVDTDIGYFIDKHTGEIYYFHPSGYLELVKFPYVYKIS